ncbi:MAG: N-acetylmuramoyl-L-alanine amidase [Syntrophales bacterium]|nr:N-acetylmuramoyl-L-alanine amidase [Syntrophales bacterium]MCK9528182.1 N-acetylmuramoyl-L-alanine amidase [Syntrophales bacterium]MDX9921329.1 N-acetylmuramoyl-L-alanine amidase [Syntrophales bacterium]
MKTIKRYVLLTILVLMTACLPALVPSSAEAAKFTVVIDAGHGGDDRGVQLSRSAVEKDVTLAIAKSVKAIMSPNDAIAVMLTRPDDRNLSLNARKDAIRSADADLLISLHVNAGFSTRASGYEIYVPASKSYPRKEPDPGKVIDEMLEITFLNNSIRFSNILDRELGRVFPREGRGVRPAPVAILNNISMAGVLIELGFSTNFKNRDGLLENHIQEDAAKMIAESIRLYFGVPPS